MLMVNRKKYSPWGAITIRSAVRYLLLTLAFVFISSGALVAGFLDTYDAVGFGIFWLLLPMTAIFIAAVVVNDRILIPFLLLKRRLGGYCAALFAMVYTLTLISIGMEYLSRRLLDLPMRISDYSSPWILADASGNSMLLALILLGLAMLHLFRRWRHEVAAERELSDRLQSYIATVRERLNPVLIFQKLEEIRIASQASTDEIVGMIRQLSDYLRGQLYELPAPPSAACRQPYEAADSRLATLLVARRFRAGRHIIFLAILMYISCGALFIAPDKPEFSVNALMGVLAMFGILATISYANILWLYPRFMKRGNMSRYAMAIGVMLVVLLVPITIMQILTYEPNVYTKPLPMTVVIISTIGSLMTLFLFIGGTSALLLLQNWICTQRRLSMQHAETIRQEYAYLRKQINPHFLFNVLNNIGITVYDAPDYARSLISDLIQLLRYQLGEMGRESTTLSREVSFIRSYFALEATRRESFEYLIDIDSADMDARIPTLLFIPFIENAVKYSGADDGVPEVEVRFSSANSRLTFTCANPYASGNRGARRSSGIGLANTRRRLDLLYDDAYSLHCGHDGNIYCVKLEIPIQ